MTEPYKTSQEPAGISQEPAGIFQEADGKVSATRSAFLAWIFGVLIIWGIDTGQHGWKMAEIPQSVQVLIGILMTGKVAQKGSETK